MLGRCGIPGMFPRRSLLAAAKGPALSPAAEPMKKITPMLAVRALAALAGFVLGEWLY
jgi:hypothetical protein